MNLVSVLFKIGTSSSLLIVSTAIIVKAIAVTDGPSGVAEFGLYRELIRIIVFLFTLSSGPALLQVLSSSKEKGEVVKNVSIVFVLNIFLLTIAVINLDIEQYPNLSIAIGSTPIWVILLTGLMSIVQVFSISLLNSAQLINKVAVLQIFSALGFLVSGATIIFHVQFTAAYAFLLMYTFGGVIGLILLYRVKLVRFQDVANSTLSFGVVSHFLKLCLACSIGTLSGGVAIYFLKVHIGIEFGSVLLGNFEAAYTLVMGYMALILVGFQSYFMPIFSQSTEDGINSEIVSSYNVLIPLAFIAYLILYIFSSWIIALFYNSDFQVASYQFRVLLAGDVFRLFSTIFGFLVLAKNRVVFFSFISVLWNLSFYIIALVLFDRYGVIAASVSYVLSHVMYYIALRLYCYISLNVNLSLTYDALVAAISVIFISASLLGA